MKFDSRDFFIFVEFQQNTKNLRVPPSFWKILKDKIIHLFLFS